MADILTRLALAGAATLFAAWAVLANLRRIAAASDAIAKIPRSRLAAFLFFAAIATLSAQKGGNTNAPPQGAMPPRVFQEYLRTTEHTETAVAGTEGVSVPYAVEMFRLATEITNETYSFAMPTNAIRHGKWWLRGAYEDVFRLDLGDMAFPLGTNLCDYVWVYAWGMVGARLCDGDSRAVATGAPMSAVPSVSQFWSANTETGGKLLTWENFFLCRDTNTPVNVQMELMPSGDFIARSNLVERSFRRVNPDDWDEDGIPNDNDLQPYVYDGDNFGPHQTLPQGANSNAYCWVDLVVEQADSLVTFAGGGTSDLPDPSFVAKVGATNRVALLIGKAYHVTSRMPIACIDRSDYEIDIDQPSATEMFICWPVTIDAIPMRSGESFSMSVWPDWLGGGFSWTNGCCSVLSLGGWSYCFSCGDNCTCNGCSTSGYYQYEGHRLSAYGGSCGCDDDDDDDEDDDEDEHHGGVSVYFSRDAVIFEDAYETSPGVTVQKRSSVAKLRIAAAGGDNGGTVTFTQANLGKLSALANGPLNIPSSLAVAPHQSYKLEFECEGASASGSANDVMVRGRFVENTTGWIDEDEERLTVAKIEIQKTINAPQNTLLNRHKFGVREQLRCNVTPSGSGLTWTSATSDSVGSNGIYRCPLYAITKPLTATIGNAHYTPLITVVEPSGIEARNPRRVTFGAGPGRAGWIGLRQEFYVKPLDVSFLQIKIEEVPCSTGGHGGYFTNSSFSVIWCHSTTNGAGRWLAVNSENRIGDHDTAALTMELLRVKPDGSLTQDESFGWADGWITWVVPFGWNSPEAVAANSEADAFREFDPQAGHRFTITTNGTVTVRKFRNEAVRMVDGRTTLNGVSQ